MKALASTASQPRNTSAAKSIEQLQADIDALTDILNDTSLALGRVPADAPLRQSFRRQMKELADYINDLIEDMDNPATRSP